MLKQLAPRDLRPIPALACALIVALAVFGWTERSEIVDPDGQGVPYLPWKLWQIAPLVMGIGGVWWMWLSTRRVPWVRSLALGVLAFVVFGNAYTDLFGDHWAAVWRTVNPIFIGSSSVAAVTLWRCGTLLCRTAAVLSAGLGALLFANGYFINYGTLWDALDPLRMITAMAWAAGAAGVNAYRTGG
ncbi:MAG: hypothetical protein OXH91_05345 [Chloroflexota bacterium]|nr:hypothetical protein [Chloroflexota bacterium]